MVMPAGANETGPKNSSFKSEMPIGGFEKPYAISRDVERHMHVQDLHARERPEKAPVSQFWMILRLCTNRK